MLAGCNRSQLRLRHDRQNQRRWMRLVMVNDVGGLDHSRSARLNLAGVEVSIETREIAARNFEPQFVSSEEDVARRPEIDADVIRLAGIGKLRLLLRTSVTHTQDSARQILRKSIR